MTDGWQQRVLSLIAALGNGARDDRARDALLCELLTRQSQSVEPYARLCRHRGITRNTPLSHPSAFPALPTDVFRYARVASHPSTEDVRVFRTSGTTNGARGQHVLSSLALYDAAAKSFAKYALFPDVERLRLIILAPHANETPDSSLSYMLTRFVEWFGTDDSLFVFRDGTLHIDDLTRALDESARNTAPVALLGTSFAFVHAEDALDQQRWSLPPRSRVMQTGGYKGKSREVEPEALRAALSQRVGVPESGIVQEYGMTELCSQLYESGIVDAVQGRSGSTRSDATRSDTNRRLIAPGWMRVTAVDPNTLSPVPRGEVGIARIEDLANIDSVCAIQTADRIVEVDDGFVLLGRAPGSTPRGCSLAMEEALG